MGENSTEKQSEFSRNSTQPSMLLKTMFKQE